MSWLVCDDDSLPNLPVQGRYGERVCSERGMRCVEAFSTLEPGIDR